MQNALAAPQLAAVADTPVLERVLSRLRLWSEAGLAETLIRREEQFRGALQVAIARLA